MSVIAKDKNIELKYYDNFSVLYNAVGPVYPGLKFSTTGTLLLLFSPTTGTTSKTRLGRKACIKSVQVRGICFSNFIANYSYTTPTTATMTMTTPGAAFATDICRLMLVFDKQANGAVATLAQILNSAVARSHLNIDNRDRFRILKDKTFQLEGGNGDTTKYWYWGGRQSHAIKIFKKLNLETTFNSGTAGTIADISTGALYLVSAGAYATATPDPYCDCFTRVRFHDIKSV